MSGMIEGLAACFTGLEDPRETRRCDHRLVDILAIAVCAVIACAESWEDIQGSRMSLASDDPEHVVVAPGRHLAPAA
jgi:DDE_Tnp_1-associated